MENVAQKGRTVLFVSHNMAAISMLCSKAILIDHGVLKKSGKPEHVIDAYLSDLKENSLDNDAETCYPDDPELSAQIKQARISDLDGTPSLIYEILQPIRINIDFVVRCYFTNLFVACTLSTTMDQIIFSTNEMDWENYTHPKMRELFPKAPGHYKATVILPTPLLNVGKYEIMLVLASPETGRVDFQRVFIDIVDRKGSFSTVPFKRSGLLAIPLKWKVEYLA